jgi:Prokaryotic Cytochrome C oxidase subunit IV
VDRSEKKLVLLWVVLTGVTLMSVESSQFGNRSARPFVWTLILAVALFKVRIVVLDFMEIRRAPVALRFVLEGWVILTCCALIGIVMFGVYFLDEPAIQVLHLLTSPL